MATTATQHHTKIQIQNKRKSKHTQPHTQRSSATCSVRHLNVHSIARAFVLHAQACIAWIACRCGTWFRIVDLLEENDLFRKLLENIKSLDFEVRCYHSFLSPFSVSRSHLQARTPDLHLCVDPIFVLYVIVMFVVAIAVPVLVQARKYFTRIFEYFMSQRRDLSIPYVSYRPSVLAQLVAGYDDKDVLIALSCDAILRSCIMCEPLAAMILNDNTLVEPFFRVRLHTTPLSLTSCILYLK